MRSGSSGNALDVLARSNLEPARRPLERAHTLPAGAFTEPAVYEREVERLFAREWLCAGREDQLPNRGDYFCVDLLGEKIVVARDHQGRIRALSRVCRHRAAEVATGTGNARQFVCPYHSWSYNLDGRLAGAPLSDRIEGFDLEACRLPEIRSEIWEGWIFVNFDPNASPMGPRLAPLAKLLAPYSMADRVAVETATYESRFNWKVLVDNFMEAYHHVATHRDTLQPIFPASRSHVPDNDGPYSALLMPARSDAASSKAETSEGSGSDGAASGAKPRELPAALVAAVVYPFHLFAPSVDSMAWYQILPERHDRFTLKIHTCFRREILSGDAPEDAMQPLHAFTKRIHEQDITACESVWSGLSSPSFHSGRLSTLEKAIWQFNQWWIERMASD